MQTASARLGCCCALKLVALRGRGWCGAVRGVVASLGPPPLGEWHGRSPTLGARPRRPAAARPTPRRKGAGGCRRRVGDVDPRYLEMLIAYEDRRFREHHGVDPLALARAAIAAR